MNDGATPTGAGYAFALRVSALVAERVPAVVVTVVAASGSTPGKAGAKMVVTASEQHGTVGGGAVEQFAVARARELLASPGGPELVEKHLTRDLAMCCGGSMSLFFDPLVPAPRLVVFGAGHVARPLASAAAASGFEVVVCDEREEWLTRERFPDAALLVARPADDAARTLPIDAATYVVVATPEHALDESVVAALLARAPGPRYLGVIGSLRKRTRFVERLVARGLDEARVRAMRIPVGVPIGALTVEEIAVSVVAELIATRRGAAELRSW